MTKYNIFQTFQRSKKTNSRFCISFVCAEPKRNSNRQYFLYCFLLNAFRLLIEIINCSFYQFTGVITHAECWENTGEMFVKYESKVSIYKLFFLVFSLHPAWVIAPVNRQQVRSIAPIKYVFNISIFQGLTGAVNHMFFTVLDPCSVLSIS